MKTVYKYPLTFAGKQFVELPAGAKPLSVVNQYGNLVLYALVDPEEMTVGGLTIRIACTGITVEFPGYRFLGTVVFKGGMLIVHVWCSR